MENFKPEENNSNLPGIQNEPENEPEIKPRISPLTASFIGLVAVFFLYQVGGSLLTVSILGFNIKNADIVSVRLLTVAGQILFFLLPALLLTRVVYSDVTSVLRFRLPKVPGLFMFVSGLLCLTPLLQSYLYLQNVAVIKLASLYPFVNKMKGYIDQIDKVVEESYSSMLASHSAIEAIMIVIVVAVHYNIKLVSKNIKVGLICDSVI
jgi:hypothetical protein